MKSEFELLKHINKDSSMAVFTITALLSDIKEKNNKIKAFVEEILHSYEKYVSKCEKLLNKNGIKETENGLMSKIGARMGIKKEMDNDNSDASVADMLIKGISMGSLDMEKKIKDYKKTTDKKTMKLAEEFLKFQQKTIEKLKCYL